MDKYNLILSEVAKAIKPSFKKKGNYFICYKSGNVGLINFQKSKDSTSQQKLFTINLGVYSNSLHALDMPYMGEIPSIPDCHWRERIGFLLQMNRDHWWTINETTSVSKLTTEIVGIVTSIIVPEIDKHISDESLKNYWLKGESAGLSEAEMYLNLIGLLKAENSAILDVKIKELRMLSKGKRFEQNIIESLRKLGIDE